jgi:uncharacterized membrane protein YqjE
MDAMIERERSIGSVVQDVVGNIGRIVRAEVRLAQIELVDAAHAAVQAAKLLGAGVVVGQLGLGLLLLAGVRGLETVVAPWLAALLVALGAAAISAALLVSGMKKLQRVSLNPSKNLESLTEIRR